MKDQFVTIEIAKKLKELGFNEWCFARYMDISHALRIKTTQPNSELTEELIACPLWQQAIDWLRENKNIHIAEDLSRPATYCFRIMTGGLINPELYFGNTYSEAREAAILKALELIKG